MKRCVDCSIELVASASQNARKRCPRCARLHTNKRSRDFKRRHGQQIAAKNAARTTAKADAKLTVKTSAKPDARVERHDISARAIELLADRALRLKRKAA